MNEQEDLFTKDQNRLMSIAGWANNLAWVMLVVCLLLAMFTIFEDQSSYQRLQWLGYSQRTYDYWEMARSNLFYYLVDVGSDILSRILSGFLCFVVLRGIALGLYMIIETDMNYREKEIREGRS